MFRTSFLHICMVHFHASGARLLSYDPGGGHTDQLRGLSLALAIAELLNRTVVLPHLLWHRDANVFTTAKRHAELIQMRPRLSSLIQVTSAVPVVDNTALLVQVHTLPKCEAHSATHVCVKRLEPPSRDESVSAHLREVTQLNHLPWLHYRSMLDALSQRKRHRYPLAAWETQMRPAPCGLRYRPDVPVTRVKPRVDP